MLTRLSIRDVVLVDALDLDVRRQRTEAAHASTDSRRALRAVR